MRRPLTVHSALGLALGALLSTAPVSAQDTPADGSEIGRLILTLKTTDGRPISGTRVVIDGETEGADSAAPIVTDAQGFAHVPGNAFVDGDLVISSVAVVYMSNSERAALYQEIEDAFFGEVEGTAQPTFIAVPTVTLSNRPGGTCSSSGLEVELGELFGGCARSEDFAWSPPAELSLEIDARCDALDGVSRDRPRATGVVTGGYLFPVGREGEPEEDRDAERDVDFFRPLLLQFPDGSGGPDATVPGCAQTQTETQLPELAVYGLHGYNLDFEDGAWGIRATVPLPFLPERNLGAALGLDFYPQDDFRSTLAVNADLTASLPWSALGDASAFVGLGPRLYRQSFESENAESSTEVGAGLISGMTYRIGPVSLYGDVGLDYVYSTTVPVTHFGAGFSFSRD